MARDELNTQYFEWMYRLVCDDEYSRGLSYRKLLRYLHQEEFYYTLPMDGNRAEDGTDLRYRFGYEHSCEGPEIASRLDNRPCSILEMMVALAIRCEEQIMDDPDAGNRTGQWFWNMIVNLGLGPMDDKRFDPALVDNILKRFMNREYGPHGEGGLFAVRHCKKDMRFVEIWYQMNHYLTENF